MALLDPTFGACLIGIIVSTFLYGILTLQVWLYFEWLKNDRWPIKATVIVSYALETLLACSGAAFAYIYLVSDYETPGELLKNNWTFNMQPGIEPIVAAIVQGFFLHRAWALSAKTLRWKLLAGLVLVLCLLQLGFGIVCGVASFFLLHEFKDFNKFNWEVGLWLGSAAAADLILAAWLIYSLYNSRTGFEKTDNIIKAIILFTINTSLLTAIAALCDMVTFITLPVNENLVNLAFNFILSKLYTNSMMASLNHRAKLQGKIQAAQTNNVISLNELRSTGGVQLSGFNTISVTTHKETRHDSDSFLKFDSPGSHHIGHQAV